MMPTNTMNTAHILLLKKSAFLMIYWLAKKILKIINVD